VKTAVDKWAPAKYLGPAVILVALVWAAPLLFSIYISFTDSTPGKMGNSVGFSNYERLLGDGSFHHSIMVSLFYAAGTVVLSLGLGLLIAIVLRKSPRGIKVSQVALLLPWVLSELAVALIWSGFLDERAGIVNTVLSSMELSPLPFFTTTSGAMTSLWLASIWRGLAFSVMLQMSAIASLPENLLYAAKIDGANRRLIFASIVWPHHRPAIGVNALFVFLMTMVSFSLPFALTKGGPLFATDVVALHSYNTAFFNTMEFGYAAAQGMAVVAAYLVLAMALVRLKRRMA